MSLLPQLTAAEVELLRQRALAAQAELEHAVLHNPQAFSGLEMVALDREATTAWARYWAAASQVPGEDVVRWSRQRRRGATVRPHMGAFWELRVAA
jgi:hypothetical protein